MKNRLFARDFTTSLSAVVSAAVLAACSPDPADQSAGQAPGRGQASVDRQSADAVDDAVAAGKDLARAAGEGLDKAVDNVRDAAITTAIHARLAMAGKLGDLDIDVDTIDGRVVLRGRAPDVRAREAATQLAMSVDGVRSVDNQLVIAGNS